MLSRGRMKIGFFATTPDSTNRRKFHVVTESNRPICGSRTSALYFYEVTGIVHRDVVTCNRCRRLYRDEDAYVYRDLVV